MYKETERNMRRIGGLYQSAPATEIMGEHEMILAEAGMDNRPTSNVVRLLRQPGDLPLGKSIRKGLEVWEESEK